MHVPTPRPGNSFFFLSSQEFSPCFHCLFCESLPVSQALDPFQWRWPIFSVQTAIKPISRRCQKLSAVANLVRAHDRQGKFCPRKAYLTRIQLFHVCHSVVLHSATLWASNCMFQVCGATFLDGVLPIHDRSRLRRHASHPSVPEVRKVRRGHQVMPSNAIIAFLILGDWSLVSMAGLSDGS